MSKLSSVFAMTRIVPTILAAVFSLSAGIAAAANAGVESAGPASLPPATAALPVSSPWPLQVLDDDRTFLIYQPQVDKWENSRLEGRSAVSVRDEDSGQQNFGVIYFSARTDIDQGTRTVTVHDAEVSRADFPAVAGGRGAEEYLSILRPQFAAQTWRVAQDRLQSDMEIDRLTQQASRQPLRNDPPRFLYSERPAVLVPIDGNPVLRPVADTGLMRVTNTRALILQDKATSRYFLFVADHWMEAPGLDGPWLATANASAQLEKAKQTAVQQDQVDLLETDAEDGIALPASPAIFVSTTPTELLQTDGVAQYAPIEGTQLLYVTNSPNRLFLDLSTQNHYALISGRWYRATTLTQGQWNYVPGASLPADFAMIPPEHPTESVRAAVPGTPQAREAAIANTVPQVATVARSAAHLEIAYDGSPVFQPVDGTALQNAVNSPVPVIRVSEESFYALDNGVWFVATSPFGPWTVTSYVPAVIYSIPRSSPLYYVTSVRVYDATPQVVYVGYTPGYVGSYVSSDNVVVYGTGWPYSPWIGSVWYGAPVTWGFGFSYFHTWWHPHPWHSWHRVAWAAPPPCFRPWWGPWHAPAFRRPGVVASGVHAIRSPGPRVHNVGRIYDRWDGRSVVWNGPRAIANHHRPGAQSVPRTAPGNGFVAGPDGRWRRLGEDGHRDQGRRGARQLANSPADQAAPTAQRPPAPQTWRRQAQRDDRGFAQPHVQPPTFGGNDHRPADARQFPPRERKWDQGQRNQPVPHARGPVFDRSRINAPQNRLGPQVQPPQHIPPVAGVPIERPQRAMPLGRSFSPPAGRVEQPAAANRGRAMEHPAMSPGRIGERSGDRPQSRGNQARGNEGRSHPGGGTGRGPRMGER